MSVYLTLLKPGDTVLGMNLAHGGHLTHGHPLNFSGHALHDRPLRRAQGRRADRLRRARPARRRAQAEDDHRRRQRLPARHRLRADPRRREPDRRGDVHRHGAHRGPRRRGRATRARCRTPTSSRRRRTRRCAGRAAGWSSAASSTPRISIAASSRACRAGRSCTSSRRRRSASKRPAKPHFADYQRQIVANAARLAQALSAAGFRLVSGGTDNHLMLVDVFSKGITGKVAEAALGKAGITVNKNAIPFDQNPPMVASGIRVGTPAVTTRGMREAGDGCHRRAHRSRAQDTGRRRRARRWSGRKSNGCAGSSRCTRNAGVNDGDPERSPCASGARRPPISRRPSPKRLRRTARSPRRMPDFEPRAGQVEMAAAVARVFEEGGVLLAEAGTGTGKTLAYLVPAILSRKRVLDLHRHEEPAGTDLLQGHPGAARRARTCRSPPLT